MESAQVMIRRAYESLEQMVEGSATCACGHVGVYDNGSERTGRIQDLQNKISAAVANTCYH